ncbi:Acetyltransferase (GNAT) family protein [Roseovarius albus]|uniref:Acetyltransferase (GNAT) family protein n=1 Tax=Roseovarius albus TaxID=1247867 RepID=A0A1X7A6D3_9RHOB|nr:GNAT family N-acetyltransferase [Roseovarius albus]SLN71817.1 Acetyltransferase (GNAT) family protein [Roseovarius albus]
MIASVGASTSTGGGEPKFALRPGTEADFLFARHLYLKSMKPLLMALDAWNEDEIETAFRGYFIPEEIRIVTRNGTDVGWIQISHTDQEYCLDQLHLLEEARGQGIGTVLINDTIAEAARENKNVSLSLVKGNSAIELYRRLGFHKVAEDSTKFHMRFVTGSAE